MSTCQKHVAAELLLERHALELELDTVVAEDMWLDIGPGGNLQVRVAEHEDDLRITAGEAVLVSNAPAEYTRAMC